MPDSSSMLDRLVPAGPAPSLDENHVQGVARQRMDSILGDRAFHAVFQPIVDLGTRTIVGYEALTRFDDGVAPDVRFPEAVAARRRRDLERVTLSASLEASLSLPAATWLNLNVSPDLVISGALAPIIRGHDFRLVLEIAEHEAIDDYGLLRRTLAAFGPNVRLAVDEAGSDYASLRHILELRPDFVKLDRGLVAGIDTDPARQALVAGVRHFCASIDAQVIAEGIETEDELGTLRRLRVGLGQGYLMGRPVPAPPVREKPWPLIAEVAPLAS